MSKECRAILEARLIGFLALSVTRTSKGDSRMLRWKGRLGGP